MSRTYKGWTIEKYRAYNSITRFWVTRFYAEKDSMEFWQFRLSDLMRTIDDIETRGRQAYEEINPIYRPEGESSWTQAH